MNLKKKKKKWLSSSISSSSSRFFTLYKELISFSTEIVTVLLPVYQEPILGCECLASVIEDRAYRGSSSFSRIWLLQICKFNKANSPGLRGVVLLSLLCSFFTFSFICSLAFWKWVPQDDTNLYSSDPGLCLDLYKTVKSQVYSYTYEIKFQPSLSEWAVPRFQYLKPIIGDLLWFALVRRSLHVQKPSYLLAFSV